MIHFLATEILPTLFPALEECSLPLCQPLLALTSENKSERTLRIWALWLRAATCPESTDLLRCVEVSGQRGGVSWAPCGSGLVDGQPPCKGQGSHPVQRQARPPALVSIVTSQ